MILKTDVKKAVELQRQFFKNKNSGEPRQLKESITLSSSFISIITGIRRCGKSTLMLQLSRALESKKDAFFNFEDPRIFGFEIDDFPKLSEVFGEKVDVYFFDEIQNVENWEIYIRNLHDQGKTICITGSNASLLSKELGTRLTGRHLIFELFPFSYSEYVSFNNLKTGTSSFHSYLRDGGFPEYVKAPNKEILQQLFKDIVYRDIVARHGIRQSKTLVDIALFLISNIGKEYSLNNIRKIFDVGSTNSVSTYVQWLEDSYLIFSISRFSWSSKSMAINPKKIYTIDTAFASANSMSFSKDSGRLLENLVYMELRRLSPEIYYYKEKGECDFIIKGSNNLFKAIQVCWEVNADNKKREIDGLIEALEFFDLETGIVITIDQEDKMINNSKTIYLIPGWKYFGTHF